MLVGSVFRANYGSLFSAGARALLVLFLFAGGAILGAPARAQAFADLHASSLLPTVEEFHKPPTRFAGRAPSCRQFSGSELEESSVIEILKTRLASTPVFVANIAFSSEGCSPSRSAQPPAYLTPLTIVPRNFCSPAGNLNLSDNCVPQSSAVTFNAWNSLRKPMLDAFIISAVKPEAPGYQWKSAMVQSVEFLVMEHTFRLVADHYLRYLLVHKPFWHDWLVSASSFDMSRWGDGDNFLVNYIGHPMQGGVTGNIYLQNDPRARSLKFGRSSAYWLSRFKAMEFSAIYSMYFEIGPGLSEVAIGNEGGYTYTPGCGHIVCDRPGYKPPTNNTGWVDFIVTPTIGTGWLIMEDAIDSKIVDRLAKSSPQFRYKVMRSMLTPTHSMANMVAGHRPWFRYRDGELNQTSGFTAGLESRVVPWKYERRWAAGAHYANLNLPMDWPGCAACRVRSSGYGLTFGYRLTNLLYADSEVNFFPGSSSSNKNGRAQEALIGIKAGRAYGQWGFFAAMRPGVIHYEKTLAPASTTDYQSATRFALDVAGIVEYYPSPRSTFRLDVGTTFVRYLTGRSDPRQLPQTVLSTDYIVTQGNFHFGSGYVFRF